MGTLRKLIYRGTRGVVDVRTDRERLADYAKKRTAELQDKRPDAEARPRA